MTDPVTTLVTIGIDVRAADATTKAQTGTVTATMPQDTALAAGPVLGKLDPIIATCTAGVWSDLVIPASDSSDETPHGWTWHFAIATDVCTVEFDSVVPHANTSTDLGTLLATALPSSVSGQSFVPLSQKGAANGVASLDGTGKVPTAQLPGSATGVTSVTAADSTIVVAGTGVAPTVAVGAVPQAQVTGLVTALAGKAPTARQITAGTGLTGGGDLSADRSLAVAYGTTAGSAAQGNDSRLSDARTPLSHAASHAAVGSDPVSPASIGAATAARQVTAGTGLTGGGDLTADRSFAVSYGTTAGTAAQGNDSRLSVRRYTPAVVADAATLLVDLSVSDVHRITLAGNRTLGKPTSGLADGIKWLVEVIQPASGGPFTLTPTADYIFGAGLADMTLSSGANTHDMFAMYYNADMDKIFVLSGNNGFGA